MILKSEKQGDRSDPFYYYSYIKHSLKEQRRKPIRNFLDLDKQSNNINSLFDVFSIFIHVGTVCPHVHLETRAQPQVLLLRSHPLCFEAGSPTENQDSVIRIV